MEVEKWKRHFRRMADGKLRPNPKGKYVVDTNQTGGSSREPSLRFVTPLAQDVELAKSELKENVYKGQPLHQERSDSKRKSVKRKAPSKTTKTKRPRVRDLVWSDRKP